MIKFPTTNGIATMIMKRENLYERQSMEEAKGQAREGRITLPQGEDEHLGRPLENKPPEKVVIHDDHPDQTITIEGNFSVKCRSELIEILRKHADAFAWTPVDMTEIPRFIAEHELRTYPHIEPRVQIKHSIAPDRRRVVKDEVAEWLKAGIVRKERYPTWVANPVLVKKPDGSWRMCIHLKDLNKAYPKDLYHLLEIDWKIESLMRFKYKCFLDAYKGNRSKSRKIKGRGKHAPTKKPKTNATAKRQTYCLEQFLSKAVEKALPCLDTLKKCTNKKDFHWKIEAEEAFKEMKRLIMKLPTLMAPKKEEELMVYLLVANEAVSAVLFVERHGRQAPIHYVSRTLQGAKINYPPMKKLVLALVHTARRLRRYSRPYNQSYHRQTHKSNINNQKTTKRLAKWGIELEACGTKYAPRSAIKGQVLADFLADTTEDDSSTQVKASGPNDTFFW
uniref:Reverse transcriptase/retrotransposon-derived protein RNase H-like domain-containing protein n=1 Tax=Tanacetum cinerariifolium TaxID=118510 RepID=A0A699GL12_TANCI|nr:hypothetical protein [Tanacetum cinerariifolium]